MSKQFNVFVLPSDANLLVDEIRSRFGLRILKKYSPTSEPVEISSPVQANSTWLRTVGSSSIDCYLAPVGGHTPRSYIEKQDHWSIDSDSEVIEFSGCDFDGWTLLAGRLYFETAYVRNSKWVKKETGFLKWADAVFRFSKRMLHRDRQIDAYLGNDVDGFRQTGGLLAWSITQGPVHAKTVPTRIVRSSPIWTIN